MAIEVQSFDDFESVQQIEAQQAHLIRVVLEGRDDVWLFANQWFVSEQETFHFIEAGSIVSGSGCTQVEAAVLHSRNMDGIPAIGIVDRDVLFRSHNWPILYEKEHGRFLQATQSTDVHVASLWEIEAYLFDSDMLRALVRACSRTTPPSTLQIDTAVEKTLAECALLLDIAPFLAGSHVEGTSVSTAFMFNDQIPKIYTEVARRIGNLVGGGASAAADVQLLIDQVKVDLPASPADQLSFYLRFVDTKRLLHRLVRALDLHGDIKWILAAFHNFGGRRPHELFQILESAKSRFST